MKREFYYLATPYTKYPGSIEAAFIAACEQTAVLLRAGLSIFSPIAHSHPVAIHGNIDPLAHDIWLPFDGAMMDAACGIIVCKLPTWDQSRGVSHEIETFVKAGKPVIYMEPGEVPAIPLSRLIAGREVVFKQERTPENDGEIITRKRPGIVTRAVIKDQPDDAVTRSMSPVEGRKPVATLMGAPVYESSDPALNDAGEIALAPLTKEHVARVIEATEVAKNSKWPVPPPPPGENPSC